MDLVGDAVEFFRYVFYCGLHEHRVRQSALGRFACRLYRRLLERLYVRIDTDIELGWIRPGARRYKSTVTGTDVDDDLVVGCNDEFELFSGELSNGAAADLFDHVPNYTPVGDVDDKWPLLWVSCIPCVPWLSAMANHGTHGMHRAITTICNAVPLADFQTPMLRFPNHA